jgi:4-hydroxy-2-oxoglutarate aldolase
VTPSPAQSAAERSRGKRFAGIFTPIVTPFRPDDCVDEPGLRQNVARWMRSPLTGLVVLGSNGEAPQLDDGEADRVIAITREGVPPDRTLIAGTGRESTKATIAATRRAAALGADAVLVRTPSFFKSQMTSDVFIRYYSDVADASPVPVLLYNVTMYTGVNLLPDAVETLAAHPNIVGMKESGGDIAQIAEYVARTPADFTLLAGSATTLFHALCAGCDGAILALAALLPEACVRLWNDVGAGKLDDARALQRRMLPLARSVGSMHGIPGLKAALDMIGFAGGLPRPPLRPAAPHVVEAIRQQLETWGVDLHQLPLHDTGAAGGAPVLHN